MTSISPSRHRTCPGRACVLAGVFCAAIAPPVIADASSSTPQSWPEQKCALYEAAVKDAISLQGPEGLRVEFLTKNQEFIDGGCAEAEKICPMTDEEWNLSELLVKMTMNEGMASTFAPFGCP